jgi:hypothetical protein
VSFDLPLAVLSNLFQARCIFIIFLPTQFAIDLQLLGGVWILQILPAVVFSLYTR